MDNKKIQRERMKKYFIDAAKEIIKEEGIKGLTARKVGERAGYSYATIYNYFEDLTALMTYCVFDLLEDCFKYMMAFENEGVDCKEQIIINSCAYFKYFAENPDMFQLIFLEDLGEYPKELIENNTGPSVAHFLRVKLEECVEQDLILKDDIEVLQDLIGSSVHSKLLFYLKRRDHEDLDNILNKIRNEIDFLISKGKN
ncbi:TetR/AcrR family transcriptional regulator [Sporosalibacterium faouarense]|uniref:TetR/AcrR family transcriptional regulator n=1 Tax=Sporosalibacterium faouarense TaxID=516123 RepID=UPI00141C5E52|nr:TetR/AcrR family transcriptional regulator [Sporosalibacterium faouarense]MTI47075.1 TetR/AcrR family transcriptional regulator [Bacillota bacterium]